MSWETYKGLELPSAPTGDAGINLKDNFIALADRTISNSAVPGSVLFVGGTAENPVVDFDSGQFCWDHVNNRLGIGTDAPLEQLQVQGNGKALLMATGSTVAESETYILFGAGTGASTQFQRLRFRYGSSNLFFERRANDGSWTEVMCMNWTEQRVDVRGNGLLIATDPADTNAENQITFGRAASNGQFQRLNYKYSTSDLRFQRRASGSSDWTTVMTLDWFGSRVGVGTESPTTLLDVAGAVTLGEYSGTVVSPPEGRAVLYIDNSGTDPILKVRFANGVTKDVAVGD
jgi:hypothetical protein